MLFTFLLVPFFFSTNAHAATNVLDEIRGLGFSVSAECNPAILERSPNFRQDILRRLKQIRESADKKWGVGKVSLLVNSCYRSQARQEQIREDHHCRQTGLEALGSMRIDECSGTAAAFSEHTLSAALDIRFRWKDAPRRWPSERETCNLLGNVRRNNGNAGGIGSYGEGDFHVDVLPGDHCNWGDACESALGGEGFCKRTQHIFAAYKYFQREITVTLAEAAADENKLRELVRQLRAQKVTQAQKDEFKH